MTKRAASGNAGRRPGRRRVQARPDAFEGPDAVVCLLCGRAYRRISYTHLRRIHGRKGPHPVEDYKRRFGLSVAVCRATRRVLRLQREEYWARHGKRWPRERVLAELRLRAREGRPLASSRLGLHLTLAIRRRFGTWERALARVGLDPEAHRLVRRWDEGSLVAAIRRRRAEGKSLSHTAVERDDYALLRAGLRAEGNWGNAVRAAGFDPRAHREPRKWSVEAGRRWVESRHARALSIRCGAVPPGLLGRVLRETGMPWTAFVESLGIPYPGGRKRLDWTDAAVLAAIRARKRRGLPLNRGAAARDGQALTHQARNRFGSWDAALAAAGFDPLSVRKSRTWTRADVLAAIRARHRAGRSMRRRDAVRDEPRLVKAAQRLFPSSWGRALKAAGLDPVLARARRPS